MISFILFIIFALEIIIISFSFITIRLLIVVFFICLIIFEYCYSEPFPFLNFVTERIFIKPLDAIQLVFIITKSHSNINDPNSFIRSEVFFSINFSFLLFHTL